MSNICSTDVAPLGKIRASVRCGFDRVWSGFDSYPGACSTKFGVGSTDSEPCRPKLGRLRQKLGRRPPKLEWFGQTLPCRPQSRRDQPIVWCVRPTLARFRPNLSHADQKYGGVGQIGVLSTNYARVDKCWDGFGIFGGGFGHCSPLQLNFGVARPRHAVQTPVKKFDCGAVQPKRL